MPTKVGGGGRMGAECMPGNVVLSNRVYFFHFQTPSVLEPGLICLEITSATS